MLNMCNFQLRVSNFLQSFARNAGETIEFTPFSLLRGPASATLPVEMPRRLSFFRTQNVTSVRPPHPMVNGDDSAHDHNALNAHNVNDLTMTMMRVVIMICLHMNVTPMII
jgi:hypothetical protein